MRTIELTAEMTKNEFRAEFTAYFKYIYIRVKSKRGQTKLGHSKIFTDNTLVFINDAVSVAEFEKDATAKTGMEVSVYYETKVDGKNSRYFPAIKEDARTSLSALEAKAGDVVNIVSQKEYMANLINKPVEREVEDDDDSVVTFSFRKTDRSGYFNFGGIDKDRLEKFGFVFDENGDLESDKSSIDKDEVRDFEYEAGNLLGDAGINCEEGVENIFYIEDADYNELNIDYSEIQIEKKPDFFLSDIPDLEAGYYIQYSRIEEYSTSGEIPVPANKFDPSKLTFSTQYVEFPIEVPAYYEISYDIVTGIAYDGEDINSFVDEFDTWDEPDVNVTVIKIWFNEDGDMDWETLWKSWDG